MDATMHTEHRHLEAGNQLDDFTLIDANGKPVHLADVTAEDGVVVGFLHGTYCAQCMQQLTRGNSYAAALREHGVSLAWVLEDDPVNIASYQIAAMPSPQFAMLPDSSPSIKTRLGIGEHPAESDTPSILYIDPERIVRYIEIAENPHAPPDMPKLIATIDAVRAMRAR